MSIGFDYQVDQESWKSSDTFEMWTEMPFGSKGKKIFENGDTKGFSEVISQYGSSRGFAMVSAREDPRVMAMGAMCCRRSAWYV